MSPTSERYEILALIARGGMADVMLARQRALGLPERLVVLKAVRAELEFNRDMQTAFLDEARLAARLSHPNVGTILDVVELDGRPCIVMEWLRGKDLAVLLRRAAAAKKPLALPIAVRILLDAAAGLAYAHRATDHAGEPLNVVHRDVSPHNIFVTREGGVKLLDFGIAKSEGRSTKTARGGPIKGKRPYMSPEQLRVQPVDTRSDLWSLGVTAWEMITGRRFPTWDKKRPWEVEIVAPSRLRKEIDPELDTIVLSLLELDPARRTQSAAEVEEALARWTGVHGLVTSSMLARWIDEVLPRSEDLDVAALLSGPSKAVDVGAIEERGPDTARELPASASPDDVATVRSAQNAAPAVAREQTRMGPWVWIVIAIGLGIGAGIAAGLMLSS